MLSALAPAIGLASVAYSRRWISDDGLINVRVVEQVLAGNGPVLNVGERVEAATSPLWILLLVVGKLIWRVDIEYVALAFGIVLSAAGLVAASAGAAIAGRTSLRHLWLPVGSATYAALPPAWDFATSGLDTSLSVAWIGTTTLLLALTEYRGLRSHVLGCAIVIGLGPLVRPDLAVMGAVFLVALLLVRRDWRLVFAAAAIPAAYQLFRMGYYGVVVPNTAIAKEASRPHLDQGLTYLGDFAGTYALAVPFGAALVALLAVSLRRSGSLTPVVAPVVAGLAHGAYVVVVGGDFMHGRLLLPSVFALLAPVSVVAVRTPARRPVATGWFAVPAAVTLAWAGLCASDMRTSYGPVPTSAGIVDEREYYLKVTGYEDPVTREHYQGTLIDWVQTVHDATDYGDRPVCVFRTMESCVEPTPMLDERWDGKAAIAVYTLGAPAANAPVDMHVIDILGLSDPHTARQELHGRGRPGHEKPSTLEWIVAKFGDPDQPVPPGLDAGKVEQARAAIARCEQFRELEEATTAPLTVGRFFENLFGAFGRSFWRYDQNNPPRC